MSKGPLPAEHFRKVPLAEVTALPERGPVDVIRDNWWRVTEDGCLLFYTRGRRGYLGSPQCNAREEIARKVGEGIYPFPTTVQQVPVVFVPHRCDS